MRNITLEELLEAGCHFGHQVTRQNPKARDYIFEARDNIHIIDLEKTKEGLEEAANYIKKLARSGGSLLVLGTKRQGQEVLNEEIKKFSGAEGEGIFWVTKRWIGGTFTNLGEVSKNYHKLKDFERRLNDENERAQFTKREVGEWEKERQKLEGFYGGVVNMKRVPDAIFIIDTHIEDLAVREAQAMNIKSVGITDTNADPSVINFPIPANDDAVGSIKLITEYILEAWKEGRSQQKDDEVALAKAEAKAEVKEAAAEEKKTAVKKVKTVTEKKMPAEEKETKPKTVKKIKDQKSKIKA